jgi:hypothetical protein
MPYYSAFSHFHFWGRRRNGSTPIKTTSTPGQIAPMLFCPSSSPWARPTPYVGEFQVFSNNMMNLSLRHGNYNTPGVKLAFLALALHEHKHHSFIHS